MQIHEGFRFEAEGKENRPQAIDAILKHISDGLSSSDRGKVYKGVKAAIKSQPPLLDGVLRKFRIASTKLTIDLSNPDTVTDLLIRHDSEKWKVAPQVPRGAVTLGKRQVKNRPVSEAKAVGNATAQPFAYVSGQVAKVAKKAMAQATAPPASEATEAANKALPQTAPVAVKRALPQAARTGGSSEPKVAASSKPIKQKVPQELEGLAKVFDKELWGMLANQPPVASEKEIVVTGYVMGDGKGDWITMCAMCKALKKDFPNNPIRLIVAADVGHKGKLEVPKGVTVNLEYFGDRAFRAPNIAPDLFKDVNVHDKVKEAGVVFYGPVDMPGLYDSVGAELGKNGIRFQEYDGSTNFDKHCITQATLGFAQGNLGIFTKTAKEQYSFQDLQNSRLRGLLFGSEETPTEDAVKAYQSKNDLYLCYTKNTKAVNLMMNAAFYSVKRDKDIDICLPAKESLDFLASKIRRAEFEGLGIGKVVITNYDENGKKVEQDIALKEGGKTMRVLDVGLLDRKDFKILTQISSPIVGCTGDSSLAQALSYGKVPFYEYMEHKRGVITSLLKVIEERFGKNSALRQYMTQAISVNDEFDHPKVALTDEVIQQAKELGEHIRKTSSARGYLKGAANETLMQTANPTLAQDIEKIRQGFIQQASPFSHARELEQARARLSELFRKKAGD